MKVIRRDPTKGYIDTSLWVPKVACNVEGVKNALTFQFFEKKEVRFLTLYKETPHHLLLPREFWDAKDFNFPVIDCRPRTYEKADIQSRIKLDHRLDANGVLQPTGDTVQRDSLRALIRSRGGILQLACGKGKTVVALELASWKKVPTLIIVDTAQLVDQWQRAIRDFLIVPSVGFIGAGEFDWKHPIVIATYTTLANRALTLPEEVRRWFGLIIWDEAHHVAAPTFARSADLFDGQRVGLTATPTRADGLHVVYNFHIGKVLFKDLKQDLKPTIFFKWTGLQLDKNSEIVKAATRDKNGELHLNKIATHLGQWRERLDIIISEVQIAVAQGRKILVLSKSIDETVNLLALWKGRKELYTDILYPTAQDIGETVPPASLEESELKRLVQQEAMTIAQLKDPSVNVAKREILKTKLQNIQYRMAQHHVWLKTEKRYRFLQREYVKDLLADGLPGGLMIHKVKTKERTEMLRNEQVTFAIMKYGREGLDEKSLDTVFACEPMSDQGALQQMMGRVLRFLIGKKDPVVMFFEDDIGPFIAMCNQLRRHLREWSQEDGGPFDYELLGHPSAKYRRNPWNRNNRSDVSA